MPEVLAIALTVETGSPDPTLLLLVLMGAWVLASLTYVVLYVLRQFVVGTPNPPSR